MGGRDRAIVPPSFQASDYVAAVPKPLLALRQRLRLANSRVLGLTLRSLLSLVHRTFKFVPSPKLRSVLQTAFPINPLSGVSPLPEIDVVIPFVEKDIEVLPFCISSILITVQNPISKVRLVTPASTDLTSAGFANPHSFNLLHNILTTVPNVSLSFDHDVIPSEMLQKLKDGGAKGWDIQQLVKFGAVMQSDERATLVVDSDTVLLSPKTWFVDSSRQLLQVANEFEDRYMPLLGSFFSLRKNFPMSFVTHHQLMQKQVVEQMFPAGVHSLVHWWAANKELEGSHLSEYESYGSFLFERFPDRAVLGSWSNLLSPHFKRFQQHMGATKEDPSEVVHDYCSVSFHAQTQSD